MQTHHDCARWKELLGHTLPDPQGTTLPASLLQHTQDCARCQRELAQHTRLRQGLASLGASISPSLAPAEYARRAIAQAAQQSTQPPRSSHWQWAAFGALAATLVLMLSSRLGQEQHTTTNTQNVSRTQVHTQQQATPKHLTSTRHPQARRRLQALTPNTPPALVANTPKKPIPPTPCHCPSMLQVTQRQRQRHRQGAPLSRTAHKRYRATNNKRSPRKNRRIQQPPQPLLESPTPTFASGWHNFPPPPPPPPSQDDILPSTNPTQYWHPPPPPNDTPAGPPNYDLPPPPPEERQPKKRPQKPPDTHTNKAKRSQINAAR